MELFKGRPADETGRAEKEIRVYDFLDNAGVEYLRVDHEPAYNMEICEEIYKTLQAVICKNLFLCNRQKTSFYLLMMPADKVFKTKELSKQFIGEFSKIISQLYSPYTPEEICGEYRKKFKAEISTETVREYIDGSLNDAEFEDRLFIYDLDRTLGELQKDEAGMKMNNFTREREEYLRQLSTYKGGVMNESTLLRFLGSSTLVFSRDYVFSPQFLTALEKSVLRLGETGRARFLLPLCVKREIENRLFDKDIEEKDIKRLEKILKNFRDMRKKGALYVKVMTDGDEYSEKDISRYLETEKLSNPCLLTLDPGLYTQYEAENSTTMYGKFLVSGDFVLYSSCLDRMGSGDRQGVRVYRTRNGSEIEIYDNGDVGGEGEVCTTGREGKVAKIFRSPADKEKKLVSMLGII